MLVIMLKHWCLKGRVDGLRSYWSMQLQAYQGLKVGRHLWIEECAQPESQATVRMARMRCTHARRCRRSRCQQHKRSKPRHACKRCILACRIAPDAGHTFLHQSSLRCRAHHCPPLPRVMCTGAVELPSALSGRQVFWYTGQVRSYLQLRRAQNLGVWHNGAGQLNRQRHSQYSVKCSDSKCSLGAYVDSLAYSTIGCTAQLRLGQ